MCDGNIPSGNIEVTDFRIIESKLANVGSSGNQSPNNTLFSVFPKKNIESTDLIDANLIVRRDFDVTVTNGQTNTVSAGVNETFLPFDEERYSIVMQNGAVQVLSADKVTISGDGSSLTFKNLSGSGSGQLVATLRKIKVTAQRESQGSPFRVSLLISLMSKVLELVMELSMMDLLMVTTPLEQGFRIRSSV